MYFRTKKNENTRTLTTTIVSNLTINHHVSKCECVILLSLFVGLPADLPGAGDGGHVLPRQADVLLLRVVAVVTQPHGTVLVCGRSNTITPTRIR